MSLDPARVGDAREWLRRASQDLKAADFEFTAVPPLTADLVFHPQHAAEKALEGFLAWREIPFRKTYDLAEIGRQCVALNLSLERILMRAAALTKDAGPFRVSW
jgi:HEPN domain-containing protein